jgi:hypothetical protein
MIKDITVNLEHQVARDPARDFAISIAEVCDTHLAGVAFAYTPEFPGYVMMEIPPDIVAQMIAGESAMADRALRCGRQTGLISAAPVAQDAGRGGADVLATLARRFVSACSCNPRPVASTTMT